MTRLANQSAFARLLADSDDQFRLLRAYDRLLKKLFANEEWQRGSVLLKRIPWEKAHDLRRQTNGLFDSPGLYIWGVDRRPIYIGITRNRFGKRFRRYIWHEWSQCNLAKQYETVLKKQGVNGFPKQIKTWYRKNFGTSTVRLNGAARFAEEGIGDIWFALFPHANVKDIRKLERALIPVAEAWNALHGYRRLLNIQG